MFNSATETLKLGINLHANLSWIVLYLLFQAHTNKQSGLFAASGSTHSYSNEQFSKARHCVKFPGRLSTVRHSALGRDIRLKMEFNTFGSVIIIIINIISF